MDRLAARTRGRGFGVGIASAGAGSGGIDTDGVIWGLDAEASDSIVTANIFGPAVSFTRADTNHSRVDSSGLIDFMPTGTLLRDYIWNGSAFVVAGFSPWEARTNICLQSEDFGTTWAAAGTPTRSAGSDSCGDVVLDLVGDDSALAIEGYTQTVTFTGNAVKSISFFFKKGTATSSIVELVDTTAVADRLLAAITWSGATPTVTVTTGTLQGVETLGNSVFRAKLQTTSVTAANTNSLRFYPAADAALDITATGDITWGGVQAENALFCGPYIKTTTASVTKAADVATLATSGIGGFSATAGSALLHATTAPGSGAVQVPFELDDGTANERILWFRNSANQSLTYYVRDGGADQVVITTSATANNSAQKAAIAWAANDFAYSRNGGAASTDTSGTLPTVTTLRIGSSSSGEYWNGPIRELRAYNIRKTNAQLVAMSA